MTDRNGYDESLLPSEGCYLCGDCETVRHEIFGGSRRSRSKAYGLWVNLCPACHRRIHAYPQNSLFLKEEGQRAAMKRYGWSQQEFISRFGRNFL